MEGVACMAGVVAVVLPPGEQVLVPRPRHRTGGKGSAELVAPGSQPAEPEPRQGGVVVPPAGQAHGRHRHPLAALQGGGLARGEARMPQRHR